MDEVLRVVIAGGGTGGHVFPAMHIAEAIAKKWQSELLFFGTERGLENKLIPQRGYRLITIPVSGIHRRFTLKNISFPFKLIHSLIICKRELKRFKPHLVIGTGGYVMGPVLRTAVRLGIPIVIQEQNSFPGLTTRVLARRAEIIFLGYEEARNYLTEAKRLIVTGNPVIHSKPTESKKQLYKFFNLREGLNTLFVFGGSQGALNINKVMEKMIVNRDLPKDCQVLWQTGKQHFDYYDALIKDQKWDHISLFPFINEMAKAYSIADMVVCRSGAITLAELMAYGVAAILVPLPSAAGDHQFKNAQALAQKQAAIVVRDDARLYENLRIQINELVQKSEKRDQLSQAISRLVRLDTLQVIVDQLEQLLSQKYSQRFARMN